DMSAGFSWIKQGLLSSSAQAVSLNSEEEGGTSDPKSSENPGLCLDTEVAFATGQFLVPSSQQSSHATSHYSESWGETPCSFNDEDEEDEDEDSSSPE
ncbi:Transcription factor Dp-2, partial [Apaloderma vittatum]